jgi:hypothetical protein
MDIARRILTRHFPNEQWTIEKPPAGLSKESYIAATEKQTIFLKFDVDTPALERLAEIGITPPVLVMDNLEGRPYIIQEFVSGQYPDRKWFSGHLRALGEFVRKYHRDKKLQEILAEKDFKSYDEHINGELVTLEKELFVPRSNTWPNWSPI